MPDIFLQCKEINFSGLKTGGVGFEFHKVKQQIKKIEVCSGLQTIHGIRFTFTDGTTDTIGLQEAMYQQSITFDYGSGEHITSLIIWKESAFLIKTSLDQEIFIKPVA